VISGEWREKRGCGSTGADEAAAYYFTYIDRIPQDDIVAVMERQMGEAADVFARISEEKSLH
jgi:hypothetical protein